MVEATRAKTDGKPSIVQHPLFPAVVAAWFGALFGLGSLVVGVGLLESVVLATGFDAVIPAAAPPLGVTARILLALGMAGLGGGIGASLARRIAQPKVVARERKRGAGPAAQFPELARLARADRAEDVEQDEAAQGARSSSRRGLLASSEGQHRPDFVERAPLPGGGGSNIPSNILNVSEFDLEGFEAMVSEDHAEQQSPADHRQAPERIQEMPRDPAESLFDAYLGMPAPPATDAGARSEPANDASPQPGFAMLEPVLEPDGDETERYEPIRLDASGTASAEPSADLGTDGPFAPPPFGDANRFGREVTSEDAFWREENDLGEEVEDDTSTTSAAERIASAPLDELSHVELLERLALTLERRRQAAAELAVQAPAAALPVIETEDEFAEDEPLGDTAPAAPPPPVIPAALRPVGLDWIDDEDDALPAYVPPRHIGVTFSTASYTQAESDPEVVDAPAPAQEEPGTFADDTTGDEETRALEEGYSSLLNLSRPAHDAPAPAPFVRIDEPEADGGEIEPVVVFPAAAAEADGAAAPDEIRPFDAPRTTRGASAPAPSPAVQDPAETERALRAALSTLQRMSGAA
ncbi:MAG TPA: hypothetical protein VJM34_04435 [Novosphingobium sp.]|nr:hypothetical protein [Novosphingobium sp.]